MSLNQNTSGYLAAPFINRRLHSLFGLIPLGYFLMTHLLANVTSLGPHGVESYNKVFLDQISAPFYIFFEVVFLYIPLLFHLFYGLVIVYQSRVNVISYTNTSNIRYVLQRVTGIVALIFIAYHIYETRIVSSVVGGQIDYLWMVRIFESSWKVWFYLVGMTAVFFHFCNGVANALVTWGLTVSEGSQKSMRAVCMLVFVWCSVLSWLVVANFTYHYQVAPQWVQSLLLFVKNGMFR